MCAVFLPQSAEHKDAMEAHDRAEQEHAQVVAKLKADKAKVENRMAMCEANLDAALEDAEALVDELQRSRELEQSLYKEKEELKSKFEQCQEAKLSVEEELAKVSFILTRYSDSPFAGPSCFLSLSSICIPLA